MSIPRKARYIVLTMMLFALWACAPQITGDLWTRGDGVPLDAHRVFVSSSVSSANALASNDRAFDDLCNALAASAGLRRSYRAIYAIGTTKAHERISSFAPGYVLKNSGLVKVSGNLKASIETPSLLQPIDVTEQQLAPNGDFAWTGTLANGNVGATCDDWSTTNSLEQGVAGTVTSTSVTWLGGAVRWCNEFHHLYCVSDVFNGTEWVF